VLRAQTVLGEYILETVRDDLNLYGLLSTTSYKSIGIDNMRQPNASSAFHKQFVPGAETFMLQNRFRATEVLKLEVL
jgi:hypothetical protein